MKLTHLYLSYNEIGKEGIIELANNFKSIPNLSILRLKSILINFIQSN